VERFVNDQHLIAGGDDRRVAGAVDPPPGAEGLDLARLAVAVLLVEDPAPVVGPGQVNRAVGLHV
jgi:hypothetical protein